MYSSLTLSLALVLTGGSGLESTFQQAAPMAEKGKLRRSPDQPRAVVLIHGFHYHFFDQSVPRAEFRPWQEADSPLVKELAKQADVYVFAYGQNASLDAIVRESKLHASIAELRRLGYRDIVLVGHSAGGLIARQFVEDHPDAGVTRVLQICAPNGGTPLASTRVPKSQQVFLDCLTEQGRKKCLEMRADKRIPRKLEFVCVVAQGNGKSGTDGVVPCLCQWTPDLQKQGIPAIGILGNHREVVRDAKIAATLANLIREDQGRWTTERIDQAKKDIFGNKQ